MYDVGAGGFCCFGSAPAPAAEEEEPDPPDLPVPPRPPGDRDLPAVKLSDRYMTPTMCWRHCWEYKYFGVQMGGTGCFCGDSFGSQGKASDDTDCNVRCTGNPLEVCGGPNLNSVYATVNGTAF